MNLHFFRLFIIIISVHSSVAVHSQVREDFSDGELFSNPAWSGDPDKFTIRKYDTDYYLLDLSDTQKGTACLSTASTLLRNTEWKFHFQLNGKNRNASSYARFYLAADTSDFRDVVRGYFVDFGSVDGLVTLMRQDGSSSDTALLIHNKAHMILSKTSNLEMRITCSPKGEWKMYADVGNGSYTLWGTAHDQTYRHSNYLGIYCTYTKTNSSNFSFGAIAVGPMEEDPDEEDSKEEDPKEEEESPPDEETEPDEKEENNSGEEEGNGLPPEEEEGNEGKEADSSGNTGFYLERRSFSPNGDGINDEIIVSYILPEAGYEIKLEVYTASGRNVFRSETWVLSESTADMYQSSVRWNGLTHSGETAPAGLYILVLKATHPVAPNDETKQVVALTD